MNVKKSLENRIRGWLPKEPKTPSQHRPFQIPTKPKPISKHKPSALWVIAVIVVVDFYMFSFIFQFSTLTIILSMITIAFAISFAVLRQKPHRSIVKFLKTSLILSLLFVVTFIGAGFYLFYISGDPLTPVPHVDYPNVLDLPLVPSLQTVEQSGNFLLLQAEHIGRITFTGLTIATSYSNAPGGGLVWTFYADDVNSEIVIEGISGYAYRAHSGAPWRDSPLPQDFPSSQSVRQSFEQIDALGLRWFYNRAVAAYQNMTANEPAVTDLGVDIAFKNDDGYQGITIALTGKNAGHDNLGNKIYPTATVFKVEFQPNGDILSAKAGNKS